MTLVRERPKLLAYSAVPKELHRNLDYRLALMRAAVADVAMRRDLMALCAEDILFWVNVFGWTFNPKESAGRSILPMVTYEFQDDDILETEKAINEGYDILKEKSRDMGATWDCLFAFLHRFCFFHAEAFLLVSRKEEYVYKPGDHKALFSKVEFALSFLPAWMLPGFQRGLHLTRMHVMNPATGTMIDGEATTGDVARGDRRTAILLDEFAAVPSSDSYRVLAATRDATNCRVFNSTPNGVSNAFHEQRDKVGKRIWMHWSRHPVKAAGLYVDETGKYRSPWYDAQCKRAASLVEIAQELDIDYLGSNYQFYPPPLIEDHKKAYVCPPYMEGDLEYDPVTAEADGFLRNEDAPLKMWLKLADGSPPPKDRSYVVGCDVSQGTGSSNSTAVVIDRRTRELVAEYANPRLRPEEFATLVVALCRWFTGDTEDGAFLAWEANGPGRGFGDRVIELGYRNIFMRVSEHKITRRVTDFPGWWSSKQSRLSMHMALRRALKEGELVCRSVATLNECLEYVHTTTGDLAHMKSLNSVDPTGARDNHADRVVALGIALQAICEYRQAQKAPEQPVAPPGSFLERRRRRETAARESRLW